MGSLLHMKPDSCIYLLSVAGVCRVWLRLTVSLYIPHSVCQVTIKTSSYIECLVIMQVSAHVVEKVVR